MNGFASLAVVGQRQESRTRFSFRSGRVGAKYFLGVVVELRLEKRFVACHGPVAQRTEHDGPLVRVPPA
jgi:hypothetical protein